MIVDDDGESACKEFLSIASDHSISWIKIENQKCQITPVALMACQMTENYLDNQLVD